MCFYSQCPQCCSYSTSRRLSTALLADLGMPRSQPKGSINFEGGLCTSIQSQAPTSQRPPDNQWLCRPPQRNLSLRQSVQTLLHKRAMEIVRVRTSLAFYNRLFIVPKPNRKWRPVLDLSALNKFFSVKTFKMETPETIRISLQPDFSYAYFHIPIHTGSWKYLRFHFQNQSYQFRALPFGLSTAPMEFTCVVKEVQLMAQARGIRIHQYLDDWLILAPTKESCHQGTQSLLVLCQELGWLVNLQKSELEPQQVFEFVGYRYDFSYGLDQGDQCPSRPTFAPPASCHSNLYRCLKRRLGCSLRRLHHKRFLVSTRKSPSYKFPRNKSSLAALKKIPASSARKSCSSCHRQHHSCGLHQQGGRYEVRLTLCPSMATPLLVQSQTGGTKGQAHPRSSECDCGQIVLLSAGHSDRVVPSSEGF